MPIELVLGVYWGFMEIIEQKMEAAGIIGIT